jgi:L,D-transpeptidase YcbB
MRLMTPGFADRVRFATTSHGSRRTGRVKWLVVALGLFTAGCDQAAGNSRLGGSDVSAGDLGAALASRLDSLSTPSLDSVYARPAAPLWVDESGLTSLGRSALERLSATEGEGIASSRYGLSGLPGLEAGERISAAELARLETSLTSSLLLLARDLAQGVVTSTSWDHGWRIDSLDHVSLPVMLASGEPLLDLVQQVGPKVRQYEQLQGVLVELEELRDAGGWSRLDVADTVLEVGDSSRVVVQLRDRLRMSLSAEERGLAAEGAGQPALFDEALMQSLSSFQGRHDIERDGVLGPGTIEVLNTPVEDRIGAVELALERWRWLPADLGDLAVLVNTPGREVHVVEDGAPRLSMKAIIGQQQWETVLFQGEMDEIVVNPYWHIPESIMKSETLPNALADEDYLRDNDFEIIDLETEEVVPLDAVRWDDVVIDTVGPDSVVVEGFPYRIRQKPGEKNALGTVKFLFPNEFAIYLHDTPAGDLFDERLRTFSHGCVRVERPVELAHLLLNERSTHSPREYDAFLATREEHSMALDPVPTYLIYQTVWVDDDGVPTFMPDVYGRDAEARAALAAAYDSS